MACSSTWSPPLTFPRYQHPDPDDEPCVSGAVIGWGGGYVKPVPATCRRWSCDDCGKRNAKKLAARIAVAGADRFITLTARAQPGRDLQDFLDELNAAWRDLWKRILRRFEGQELGYVKVVELTKAGTPHLHIAVRAPYMPQAWLSASWSELTGYHRVDVRKVTSERGLVRYLSKYLTKTHEMVQGRRKWSASKGFLPLQATVTTAPNGTDLHWSFAPYGAAELLQRLSVEGWTFADGWWRAPGAT